MRLRAAGLEAVAHDAVASAVRSWASVSACRCCSTAATKIRTPSAWASSAARPWLGEQLPRPQMHWNQLAMSAEHRATEFAGLGQAPWVYFVHCCTAYPTIQCAVAGHVRVRRNGQRSVPSGERGRHTVPSREVGRVRLALLTNFVRVANDRPWRHDSAGVALPRSTCATAVWSGCCRAIRPADDVRRRSGCGRDVVRAAGGPNGSTWSTSTPRDRARRSIELWSPRSPRAVRAWRRCRRAAGAHGRRCTCARGAGVARVVMGSAAVRSPDLVDQVLHSSQWRWPGFIVTAISPCTVGPRARRQV